MVSSSAMGLKTYELPVQCFCVWVANSMFMPAAAKAAQTALAQSLAAKNMTDLQGALTTECATGEPKTLASGATLTHGNLKVMSSASGSSSFNSSLSNSSTSNSVVTSNSSPVKVWATATGRSGSDLTQIEGVVGTVAGGDFDLAGVAGGASFFAPFLVLGAVFAGISSIFSAAAAGSLAKET